MKILYIILLAPTICLSGCVSGNKGVEVNIPESNKSTTAENIDAAGKVLGGAWDRLFHKESE